MRILQTAEAGDWLTARAGSWATAGGVAGTGFEAYARILHPLIATRFDPPWAESDAPDFEHREVDRTVWRWADVARRNGRIMHPQVQWTALTDDGSMACTAFPDGWVVSDPAEGDLELDCLATLLEHLAQHTSTAEQLYGAVWDGFSSHPRSAELGFTSTMQAELWALRKPVTRGPSWRAEYARLFAEAGRTAGATGQGVVARAAGPKMEWPGREFFLFTASAEELSEQPVPCPPDDPDPTGWDLPEWCTPLGGNTPQMLWPDDHQWVLASEIDWDSTIIAGPRPLIDRILTDERLEAYEVTADTSLTWESDTRNPNPHH
ncbi:hypothetical protein NQ038_12420 [Brevibacterium sp. 50QC2O2]|uniref:hypothetical protein n=1 Tax=Brevibacterium sp. 50QC2O2 TaxID=2968459 RepID=UPI00211C7A5F|nr:hypothetical protein [Brevibacterium sp. 50QC2O2]MCQ9389444.1 hypothetical protein [Brevibacterium sp. 50QC2O2]